MMLRGLKRILHRYRVILRMDQRAPLDSSLSLIPSAVHNATGTAFLSVADRGSGLQINHVSPGETVTVRLALSPPQVR